MRPIKIYIRTILNESLLDDDDSFYDPENDKKVIENWIRNNYNIVGKLTISDDFVVNCSGEVRIKNKSIESLTNGLFQWGTVNKAFCCSNCENLKSLEGAPKEVMNSFDCSSCHNLKSLEGAPKAVGIHFWCNACDGLESLKGAPLVHLWSPSKVHLKMLAEFLIVLVVIN